MNNTIVCDNFHLLIFFFIISKNTEVKSLKIYNTAGQQLDECSFEQTSKGNYTAVISSKLSKGIYFLRVITGDNTAFVSKLMVD